MFYQPRYVAFLRTGIEVSNVNFMCWISDMIKQYTDNGGKVYPHPYGSPSIADQDDFTRYLNEVTV